jgi:hypothetical protein
MNLMDYLAFGGLERLLLIGAAILITYWGYHLYGKAQIAGLGMIAVAALLLMSVVLTSGRHQQAVNANLLAALPAPTPISEPIVTVQPPVSPIPAEPMSGTVERPGSETGSTEADSRFLDAASPTDSAAAEARSADTPAQAVDTPQSSDPVALASIEDPDRIDRLVPLASGQELGGRITSVRSENVTLEWSAGDSRRRIISASSTP